MNCPLLAGLGIWVSSPTRRRALADLSGGLFDLLCDRWLTLGVIHGEPAWAVKQGQGAIHVAVYPHTGLDVVRALGTGRDLQLAPLEAHAVVVAHGALELHAQNVG